MELGATGQELRAMVEHGRTRATLDPGAGGMALSVMAKAVQTLYGMATDVNEYLDQHIVDMKGSENPTISRTGRILEMAKLGFGIGYITPVVVIAAGQLLLGNTLSAITTVATAATAMTGS